MRVAVPLRVGRVLRLVRRAGEGSAGGGNFAHHCGAGAVLDTLLKLLHPVMPFVTEALWKAFTGEKSLVIAEWPKPSGFSVDSVAAQRVTDMQKLVTEVRRFRSDQGLADRQKVPARLTDIAAADLDSQIPAVTSLAWLTPASESFSPSASSRFG